MKMMNRRTLLAASIAAMLSPVAAMADQSTISAADALDAVQAGTMILIDVRRPEEWMQTGVAEGAWLLDMTNENFGAYLMAVLDRNPDHDVAIICRTGNRTGFLMEQLAKNGIDRVLDVSEGMAGGPNGKGWIPSGLPVADARATYEAMPKDLIAVK
jgi:rhodanese-related sulfurtransferase